METHSVPMSALTPLMEEILTSGGTAELTVTGRACGDAPAENSSGARNGASAVERNAIRE